MLMRLVYLLNLWRSGRLVWRLMKDSRVPLSAKFIVPGGVLYALFPVDFMPDFFLALGQLDDLTVLLLSVMLFLRLCPQEVVREHVERLAGLPRGQDPEDPEKVIDGEFRVME